MARPFGNPLVEAVELQMEGLALIRRGMSKVIAANQIIDPMTFATSTSQTTGNA